MDLVSSGARGFAVSSETAFVAILDSKTSYPLDWPLLIS